MMAQSTGGPGKLALLSVVSTLMLALVGLGLAYVLRRDHVLAWFRFSPGDLALAAAGSVLGFLLAGGLYLAWPALRSVTNRVAVGLVDDALDKGGWGLVALTVLASPVGEEILFRGALQPTLGLWLTSALFGLAHGGWRRNSWPYAVAAGLLGVIVGGVFLQTGSLTASSLTHVLYNAVLALFMARRWWPFREV